MYNELISFNTILICVLVVSSTMPGQGKVSSTRCGVKLKPNKNELVDLFRQHLLTMQATANDMASSQHKTEAR